MKTTPLVRALSMATLTFALGCGSAPNADHTSGAGKGGDGGAGVGGSGGSGGTGGGADACGNGLDDDGNGLVDDGCLCTPGAEQTCYGGDAKIAGYGLCSKGKQTCVAKADKEFEQGVWGDCAGWTAPKDEVCGDGLDQNCDGQADEGCVCPPPGVTIDGLDNPLACGASTTTAKLVFDQPVTGVAAGDTVTISGGAKIDSITGGPAVYDVALSGLSGAGPFTLEVLPIGKSQHVAVSCGSNLPAAVSKEVLADTGESPTVEVAINPLPCDGKTAQATLTFSAPVTGVVAGDTVVATAGAQIASITGGPAIYTVDLTSLSPGSSYDVQVLPVGGKSKIASQSCAAPLEASASAKFKKPVSGKLVVQDYDFASLPAGADEATLTLMATPGGMIGEVAATLDGPFTWKGGAYPGTGGTCGATIADACTVVVTHAPQNTCQDFGHIKLEYADCVSPGKAGDGALLKGPGTLNDHAIPAAEPRVCNTFDTLYVSPSGNDANDGKSEKAPKKTVGGAVAAAFGNVATEIRVAGGTYNEVISGNPLSTRCIEILGGYDATFAVRDPSVHVTSIVGDTPNGVLQGIASYVRLDGLTVKNNHAGAGVAVWLDGGPAVVGHSKLLGTGDGGAASFGNFACGAVHHNSFQGQVLFAQASLAIYQNVMSNSVKTAFLESVSDTTFADNTVYSDQGQTLTVDACQGLTVERNRLAVGAGPHALLTQNNQATVYRNNYFFAKNAIYDQSSTGDIVFANNTVVALESGALFKISNAILSNNLFVTVMGGGGGGVSGPMPLSLQNNVFVGGGSLGNLNGTSITTAAQLNGLDKSPIAGLPGSTARVQGNAASLISLPALLVSATGADMKYPTMADNDWHLLTGDTLFTQGGKDTSGNDCGTYQAPQSCGGVLTDIEGLPRSLPYSVGAHEK